MATRTGQGVYCIEERRSVFSFADGVVVSVDGADGQIEMLHVDAQDAGSLAMTGDTLTRLVRVRDLYRAQHAIIEFLAVSGLVPRHAAEWLNTRMLDGWTEEDTDAAHAYATRGNAADEAVPAKLAELIATVNQGVA